MRLIKYFLFFIAVLVFGCLRAQEQPPIRNFPPEITGVGNQNWGISQSPNNFIYVANNSGLLEYNGSVWKLYESPNNTVVRSVKVVGEKIFTGSYMEFGFWQKDKFGILDYTSLSQKIKATIIEEDFWNIVEFESFILFQSLKRIYIYDTIKETFNIISVKNPENILTKLFSVDETLFFQEINEGLFRIENGRRLLFSNHTIFKTNFLTNIFLINKELVFQSQDKGIYTFKNNILSKWDIASKDIFANLNIYSSYKLKNGNLALGTISNGVYILDTEGEIISKYNQEKGINNNTVLSIFEDSNQNLWLGLDNGVSVINLNSPFISYTDIKGKLGSVYVSAIFDDKIYLGTNQGLFFLNINSNDEFEFIEGTKGQVWSLKIINNSLFCGHNSGTFVIENDVATKISSVLGTWDIKPINAEKTLLLQGNYDGLHILEKKGGKWLYRNKLDNFNISSRHFSIFSENTIFVNNEYKGVLKLSVDKNLTLVNDYSVLEAVPKGLKSSLINYEDNLLYYSEQGVYKYNIQKDEFIIDELISANLFDFDSYISGKLVVDKERNILWAFTEKNIIYFLPGRLNKSLRPYKIALPNKLRSPILGYESISHFKKNTFLLGNSNGYILIDLDKFVDKEFEIYINSIKYKIINQEQQNVPLKDNYLFDSNENNLYFNFSVPEFNKYFEVNYQYRLEGLQDNWSEYSTDGNAVFENLPFGKYTFYVRAKIGNTISHNIAKYEFEIDKPWYVSHLLLAIYFIVIISILLFTHFAYKRNFEKKNNKLIAKKQREFEINNLKNEKEIMNLKNEKLKQEIENKTRELSTSTLNIVKKNEILNEIKKELLGIDNEAQITPVIKLIDQNIKKNTDWKRFEEAFNNADTNFIKEVKRIHPKLTPNDLRLCAYLRLNLSSKEIAPLLGISPRSIEIKRYRLRKKLELEQGRSLVEYILKL